MRRTSLFLLLAVPAATLASPQDLPSLPPPPSLPAPQEMASRMIEQRFSQADTNHDGKLTLVEAKSGMPLIVPVSEDIRERRRCRHDMVQGKVAHSFDRILVNGFTVKISIFSRSYTASKIMPGLADDDDGRRRRIGWLSLQFALV